VRQRPALWAFALAALTGSNAGCVAHIANETPNGNVPTGSPSGSPTGASPEPSSSPNPADCTRQSKDPSTTIVISISPDFGAATSTYGPLFGFAVYDPTSSPSVPSNAAPITASTSDVVQFVNVDANTTNHTGTALGTSGFPSVPYTFPAAGLTPTGGSIGSAFWSTGILASYGSSSDEICWSQPFGTHTTGTYYFGDDPLYNSVSSFRGVIVVQ
jgi:hypothetical protein